MSPFAGRPALGFGGFQPRVRNARLRSILTALSLACAACGDEPLGPEPEKLPSPVPFPDVARIPFDVLGGRGRIVFQRIAWGAASAVPDAVLVLDLATRSGWGFSGGVLNDPAVAPGGERIALTRPQPYDPRDPWLGYAVYTVDARGGDLRRITEASYGHDRFPSWSPDGTLFSYYDGVIDPFLSLHVYRYASDGAPTLIRRFSREVHCPHFEGPISVSVHGRLAFSAGLCGEPEPDPAYGIWLMEGDGTGLRRFLATPADSTRWTRLLAPSWSLDGERIAYLEVAQDADGRRQVTAVRIAGVAGGDPVTVVELEVEDEAGGISGEGMSLCWSPDGSLLAFSHPEGGWVSHAYVVRTDGTGLTRVTSEEADNRSVSWSR